jgi:hypothetical protein
MDHRSNGRQLIDVEDIVVWACAELTKRRDSRPYDLSRHDASLVGRWTRPPGFPAISPMFRAAFGDIGAGSSSEAGTSWDRSLAPRAAGQPDVDAQTIEAAIAMLPEQMKSLTAPDCLALDFGFPIDAVGAFAAALANVVNLVRVYGALGKRPPLETDAPRPYPVPASNGQAAVWVRTTVRDIGGQPYESEVKAKPPRGGAYEEGAYCLLEFDPDPQFVVNARAEYFVWRSALELLAEDLSGALERFSVLAPSAPLAPWLGERDAGKPQMTAAGVIYGPMEILALEAQRRAHARRRLESRCAATRRPARPGRSAALKSGA